MKKLTVKELLEEQKQRRYRNPRKGFAYYAPKSQLTYRFKFYIKLYKLTGFQSKYLLRTEKEFLDENIQFFYDEYHKLDKNWHKSLIFDNFLRGKAGLWRSDAGYDRVITVKSHNDLIGRARLRLHMLRFRLRIRCKLFLEKYNI